MAIIYSYPTSTNLTGKDILVLTDPETTGNPTKSVTLASIASYVTGTGTGTGTTNTLTLWTDGPGGSLGDSILTQDVGATALTLNGNFISTGTGNFTGQVTIPTTPAAATDAASKNYVDTEVAGIPAGLVFKGNWDANLNSPALASGVGTVGNYYVVSVAGNTNLDGITDWQIGDWAVFVEVGGVDKWDKIDQTFVSGNGAIGQVTFWNTINTVDGDNAFYWDNLNKKLGIGTTLPASKLSVVSTNTNSEDIIYLQNGINTVDEYLGISFTTGVGGSGPHGAIRVYNGPSASDAYMSLLTTTNGGTLTQGLTQNHLGYIGIGTTTPSENLQVGDGTGNHTILISSQTSLYKATTAGTGEAALYLADASQDWRIQKKNNENNLTIRNQTTSDDVIVIDSVTNNVGIGMSSPTQKLSLPDNAKIGLGDSADLRIDHDGTDSNLENYTGDLRFRQFADNKDIIFQSDDGSGGTTEYFRVDGGAERNIFSKDSEHGDSISAYFGSGNNMRILYNGSHGFITQNVGGDLRIVQNVDDGDILFQSDDGSGGVTTYFKIDGGLVNTVVLKDFRFEDNVKGTFGSSQDLNIFHDSANSYLENKVGNLILRQEANDADIIFKSDDGSGGDTEYFRVDGGNEHVVYSKSIIISDGISLKFGDGSDLVIQHNQGASLNQIDNNNFDLYIQQNATDKDIIFRSDDGSGGLATYFTIDGGDERLVVSKNMDFLDNVKLRLGTGSGPGLQDLQIYHDGSNSYIDDAGTGRLNIRSSGITIGKYTGENGIIFNADAEVKLYYDNSAKLETTNTGALVTGDLEIANSSDGIILESPNGTRYRVTIDNSGNLVRTAL